MIRILLIDDHPALRAGLETVLRAEPGLVPVGAASDPDELWPLLNRTRPDVLLLDYHLPKSDGLVLCHRVKQQLTAPRVLLYSAYADTSLILPAVLAGADGIVHKGTPASELYEAIRRVARGEQVLPPVPRELLARAGERLEPADLPILGMLLDRTPLREIAEVVGAGTAELAGRVERMIERLRLDVGATFGEG